MVRGLASDLPAGVDLSKAKAWCYVTGGGSPVISASYNIKSLTDSGTGNVTVTFGIPFKSANHVGVGTAFSSSSDSFLEWRSSTWSATSAEWYNVKHDGTIVDDVGACVVFFGELENE